MKHAPTSIVLGAGVVGLCVARRLARFGRRVVVLEKRRIGGGASGAAAGILSRPINERSPFQRRCARAYDGYLSFLGALEAESGERVERLDSGMLYLACDDEERAALRRKHDALLERGRSARWMRLDGVDREGVLVAETARVHPPALLVALRRALERAGGELREATDGTLDELARGADEVVVCGGAWSGEIARELDIELEAPIVPIRGQMAEYRCRREPPAFMIDVGEVYIIPRPAGRVWIGATVEDIGFEDGITPGGLELLLENARLALPWLEASDLVTAWSGLRPKALRRGGALRWSGSAGARPRLALLAGHYRNGILVGPCEADDLVAEITGEPLEGFSEFALEATGETGEVRATRARRG